MSSGSQLVGLGSESDELSAIWSLKHGAYNRVGSMCDEDQKGLLIDMFKELDGYVFRSGRRKEFNGFRLWKMRHTVVSMWISYASCLPQSQEWRAAEAEMMDRYDAWYPLPGNGRVVVEQFQYYDIGEDLWRQMVEDGVPSVPRSEMVCLVSILKQLDLLEGYTEVFL